jgi:hypothetical protein
MATVLNKELILTNDNSFLYEIIIEILVEQFTIIENNMDTMNFDTFLDFMDLLVDEGAITRWALDNTTLYFGVDDATHIEMSLVSME